MEEKGQRDFIMEKKVYYHDTDCGGVVYYANYLKHLEEARTEYLTSRGVDLKRLTGSGIVFAVVRVEIEYRAPARYQDTIRIFTRVGKVRKSLMQFFQVIMRDDTKVAEAKVLLACLGPDQKTVPVPEEIRRAVTGD